MWLQQRRCWRRKAAAIIFCLAGVHAGAQTRQPPITPDLDGIWNFSTLTPLERPPQLGDKASFTEAEAAAFLADTLQRNNRDRRDGGAQVDVGRAVNDGWFDRGTTLARVDGLTSLIVDPPNGRVPALTEAARSRAARDADSSRRGPADGPESRSLQERCLMFNAGPPILPGPYNNYLQIQQFPGYVVLFTEMIHDARIVPLDNHPRVAQPRWMGEPRGRWEGTSLVIESAHFTTATDVRGSDEQLRLTERFTRTSPDELRYEFTVDNPTAFERTWTAVLPMSRSDDRMFEYACHEGNHALEGILRGARAQERR